jgi:glucokinase
MNKNTLIGAVDIGGTKIAAGVVDASGKILASLECPTEARQGPQEAVLRIARMLETSVSQSGGRLAGIGVGCTGPVYPDTGLIGLNEFLPGWEGYNLVEALSGLFDLQVAIENDADAAALGEWAWGTGQGAHNFMLVTVGTGIGAGLVLDGCLYRGVQGSHPEIGHHVIDPSGPACFCGARGCWESLASGPALERWAKAHFPTAGWQDARQICQAAQAGHPLAQQAVARQARYLGAGLANLVTLFTPERIALGGGIMESRRLFWDAILETIRTHCSLVPYEQVQIVPASLGVLTGLAGAAQAWLARFDKNSQST